jgi:ABC-type transport system involved in cytochrome bd biosynthesis fused ATPase/permease subunit
VVFVKSTIFRGKIYSGSEGEIKLYFRELMAEWDKAEALKVHVIEEKRKLKRQTIKNNLLLESPTREKLQSPQIGDTDKAPEL